MKINNSHNHNNIKNKKSDMIFNIKDKLIKFIESSPGIRYRELSRATGLSNGVLSYHLCILESDGKIIVDRREKNNTTRFFPLATQEEDSNIIAFLRNKTSRKILKIIHETDVCTFNKIADRMDKAPSTVSWHLKRMKESKIIKVDNIDHSYKIVNEERMKEFVDNELNKVITNSVDAFIDVIDEF